MQQKTGNSFSDLYFANKCFIAVFVVLAIVVYMNVGSQKRGINRLQSEREHLNKQKEQGLLLEKLYHSLEEKQASENGKLVFFDPGEQAVMKNMSPREIVRYLAGKNHMAVDWIDEVDDSFGPDSEKDRYYAVSLQGDFLNFKAFMLDLLSWPLLRKLPLIQVFAGKNRLDILVKFKLESIVDTPSGGYLYE